jgi:hypothetical protein
MRELVRAGVRYIVWYQLLPNVSDGQWDTSLLDDETSIPSRYTQLRDTFSAIHSQ